MEKYSRAGQATDKNMAHVHGVLDTEGYTHIHTHTHAHTHSEYIILTAFPLQQWLRLHKSPGLVRYLQRYTRSFRSSITWRRLTWATCARPSDTTILFARKSEHESPK